MDEKDKNSLEVAMEALRRIENHERECSNRWERLGWFIATGVGIGFIFLLLKSQLV